MYCTIFPRNCLAPGKCSLHSSYLTYYPEPQEVSNQVGPTTLDVQTKTLKQLDNSKQNPKKLMPAENT